MSALHGKVEHVSGYDPRSVVIDLDDGGHDLKPDDEVAVHAVKHAGDGSSEMFDEVLGRMLGEAYGGRLIEHLETLEAIVRDLAVRDPYVDGHWCRLCGRSNGHGDSCPWRRSVDWMEANGRE